MRGNAWMAWAVLCVLRRTYLQELVGINEEILPQYTRSVRTVLLEGASDGQHVIERPLEPFRFRQHRHHPSPSVGVSLGLVYCVCACVCVCVCVCVCGDMEKAEEEGRRAEGGGWRAGR